MSQHVVISVERGGFFSIMVIILSVCISTELISHLRSSVHKFFL